MRIGIIALLQESNTFAAEVTSLSHFQNELLVTGAAVRERMAAAHHEVGGFFEVLDRSGAEAVGLFAARAIPNGVIVPEAFDYLVETMLAEVKAAGPLDGYLVAIHG